MSWPAMPEQCIPKEDIIHPGPLCEMCGEYADVVLMKNLVGMPLNTPRPRWSGHTPSVHKRNGYLVLVAEYMADA